MENKKAALAALVRKWCEEKDNAVRMESRMKTVIAIDSFKGSMTSMEAGNAAAAGVKAVFPDAEIVVRPLADGGEGTVEALTTGMGGRMETALVSDPLGRKISASYGILEKNKTAVIEMAAAAVTFQRRTQSATYNDLRRWGADPGCNSERLQAFYCRDRRQCDKRRRSWDAFGAWI